MRTLLALAIVGFLAVGCNAFTDTDEIPRPVCGSDADCDDGVFCNGPETCAPDAEGADGLGCVAMGAEAFLDDGVDCTEDRCDEATTTRIHDASACECQDDAGCRVIHQGPCVEQVRCDGGACAVTLLQTGTACDDGVACTTGTVCTDAGECAGTADDAVCDDGTYCNGEETCAPESSDADGVSGCVSGPAPTMGADITPACAEAACDEAAREVIAVATDACSCRTAANCGAPGDCRVWRCDADTGFTCEDAGPREAGSVCDDGLSCTVDDRCDVEGVCSGAVAHALCDDDDICNGGERCSPTEGCLAGVPPDPLPLECQ